MGTYNPDTATKITASLEGSENGRHFWVTTPEGEKVPADGSEVADYAFGIDGVRQGQLPAIQQYREAMRKLVGRRVTVVIQETDEEPRTLRITDIEEGL